MRGNEKSQLINAQPGSMTCMICECAPSTAHYLASFWGRLRMLCKQILCLVDIQIIMVLRLLLLEKDACTTRPEPRGVRMLASACALCLPCTLVQVFQVHSGDSKGSRSVSSGLKFRSNMELECHPERGEHRGQV